MSTTNTEAGGIDLPEDLSPASLRALELRWQRAAGNHEKLAAKTSGREAREYHRAQADEFAKAASIAARTAAQLERE